MRSRPGARPSRTASTTTTGRSAATAPLTLMSALRTATASVMKTMSRVRLSPDLSMSHWPTQAVTPDRSIPALMTKSEATKIVAVSPKPARLCWIVRMPVAQSASAQPTQTAITGSLSQMNRTMTTAMMAKTIQMSVKGGPRKMLLREFLGPVPARPEPYRISGVRHKRVRRVSCSRVWKAAVFCFYLPTNILGGARGGRQPPRFSVDVRRRRTPCLRARPRSRRARRSLPSSAAAPSRGQARPARSDRARSRSGSCRRAPRPSPRSSRRW